MCFTRYVNLSNHIELDKKSDISLVVFSPGSANKRWVRWETKWSFDGNLCQEYSY